MFPNLRPRIRRVPRRGSVVVWTSLLLVVLIGMVGLVIDSGLLLGGYRHAQNAADAAALAAALDLLRGETAATAIATGTTFVTSAQHNNLPGANVTINIPPASGPYAGNSHYAEAIVTTTRSTIFIRVLPGAPTTSNVTGRAVAGFEWVAAGEGVIALNPSATPGLKLSGSAQLVLNGSVLVNSEGGGVDENGVEVTTGGSQTAISVSNNATISAVDVNVVGGVNDPDNFTNFVSGGPNPLHANGTPTPDPLLYMPTPTTANGVVNVRRGSPQATNKNYKLNNNNDNSGTPNFVETVSGVSTMVLRPGIYDSISITGGRVRFEPGIYVLKPAGNVTDILTITGGTITANGIMFYNTGSDYDPVTGAPDSSDGASVPNAPSSVRFGGVKINAGTTFQPLDTATYSYSPAVSSDFDEMLFYYRRWNTAGLQIEGNSSSGNLAGTLYAKWANAKITGQGTYDAQFMVGSMELSGQGNITLNYDGNSVGKAPRIFLVE